MNEGLSYSDFYIRISFSLATAYSNFPVLIFRLFDIYKFPLLIGTADIGRIWHDDSNIGRLRFFPTGSLGSSTRGMAGLLES